MSDARMIPLDFTPAEARVAAQFGLTDRWVPQSKLLEVVAQIDASDGAATAGASVGQVHHLYALVRWYARIGVRATGWGSIPPETSDPFVSARFRASRERSASRSEFFPLRRHLYVLDCLEENPRRMPTRKSVDEHAEVPSAAKAWDRLLPDWARLVAPPLPERLLPSGGLDGPDLDAVGECLAWSGTLTRIDALAEACDGPARWARAWTLDFYARCLADPIDRPPAKPYEVTEGALVLLYEWQAAVKRMKEGVDDTAGS